MLAHNTITATTSYNNAHALKQISMTKNFVPALMALAVDEAMYGNCSNPLEGISRDWSFHDSLGK